MKKAFDLNDSFFKPLWIRVLIVVATLAWGAFEFTAGSPAWGTLFCGIGAYAFYGFFIAFDPRDPVEKDENAE
ncbi:MAG: DUF3329 domain-containing protein [Rhizobiaceae bacterium]|nr:DUF3329 domain-containing protein [Rhizobiaceae bacterium]